MFSFSLQNVLSLLFLYLYIIRTSKHTISSFVLVSISFNCEIVQINLILHLYIFPSQFVYEFNLCISKSPLKILKFFSPLLYLFIFKSPLKMFKFFSPFLQLYIFPSSSSHYPIISAFSCFFNSIFAFLS
jgi:hypothetical protein